MVPVTTCFWSYTLKGGIGFYAWYHQATKIKKGDIV